MKRFIFGIIVFVICLIVVGTFWNLDTRKEHGYDKYQKELAKREQRIKELEDSINSMQETLDFYREAVMWLRKADDKELQKNIEFIRNIPTKMIP
jgi:predicted GTPase